MTDNEPTVVDPVNFEKKTSTIIATSSDEATVRMDQQDAPCFWNDQEFSAGDKVMRGDNCYECYFGRWVRFEED